MKDTHVFYGVCSIAALAIVAVGIGYATDMLPLHKQPVNATTMSDTTSTTQSNPETPRASKGVSASKEKNCGCCAERRAKYEALIKKRRQRQKAATTAQQMASK
ncbi:hypothetical protein C6499_06670 [Candidatus Poribacteria bacterium]|nr:MAG: hypothetical protein C6499_06670 [Candidatus Poribacteria bacterium]